MLLSNSKKFENSSVSFVFDDEALEFKEFEIYVEDTDKYFVSDIYDIQNWQSNFIHDSYSHNDLRRAQVKDELIDNQIKEMKE